MSIGPFRLTADQILDAHITIESAIRCGLVRHEPATPRDVDDPANVRHPEPVMGCVLCAAIVLAAQVGRLTAILAA